MALIEIFIGGQGPFLVDEVKDADYLSHDGQVVRQSQLVGLAIDPAVSVTDLTEFGRPPNVGASARYAREDHSHGSPPDPLSFGISYTITVVVGPLLSNTKTLTFENGILTGVV